MLRDVQRLPNPEHEGRWPDNRQRKELALCEKHRARRDELRQEPDQAKRSKDHFKLFREVVRCEECWRG